jgi:hypothetical protein
MGWADCGTDSKGRPIGYAFQGACDHPGCEVELDRSLSYVCGGMHGEDEWSCEGYFCEEHRRNFVNDKYCGHETRVCAACAKALLDSGEFHFDPEEGEIVREDQP